MFPNTVKDCLECLIDLVIRIHKIVDPRGDSRVDPETALTML